MRIYWADKWCVVITVGGVIFQLLIVLKTELESNSGLICMSFGFMIKPQTPL